MKKIAQDRFRGAALYSDPDVGTPIYAYFASQHPIFSAASSAHPPWRRSTGSAFSSPMARTRGTPHAKNSWNAANRIASKGSSDEIKSRPEVELALHSELVRRAPIYCSKMIFTNNPSS